MKKYILASMLIFGAHFAYSMEIDFNKKPDFTAMETIAEAKDTELKEWSNTLQKTDLKKINEWKSIFLKNEKHIKRCQFVEKSAPYIMAGLGYGFSYMSNADSGLFTSIATITPFIISKYILNQLAYFNEDEEDINLSQKAAKNLDKVIKRIETRKNK